MTFLKKRPNKETSFFLLLWILSYLDVVSGTAGKMGNKRKLTPNDCTTEPTSSGVLAASLHFV